MRTRGSRKVATRSVALLRELVGDARALPAPEVDWDKVDRALFPRMHRDRAEQEALAAHRGKRAPWLILGGVVALAAAAMVILRPSQPSGRPLVIGSARAGFPTAPEGSAGDLILQKGKGEVRIDGFAGSARVGARVRAGQSIETRGAMGVFEAAGKVSWILEDESAVSVERSGGEGLPIALSLERGAVEAQVTPVPSGEAFAVDVAEVRIAVHGTRLRIARAGDHVAVDVYEGVVSIGARPKTGSTYGTTVTSPAHVDFQVGALVSSFRVDHDAGAVGAVIESRSLVPEDRESNVPAPRAATRSGEEAARSPVHLRAPGAAVAVKAVAARNPNAEEAIREAIVACASAGARHSNDLKIIQNSTLTILVEDDGFARNANFDPPMPDLQACVARAIWSTRFVEAGTHTLQVAVER